MIKAVFTSLMRPMPAELDKLAYAREMIATSQNLMVLTGIYIN